MWNLVRRCYSTYKDPKTNALESHSNRLSLVAVGSLLLAILSAQGFNGSLSLMGTAISVIAGFAFAALFSGNSVAVSGLPDPKDAEDLDDLKRLGHLDESQKCRTEYFLMICLFELALIAVMSISFQSPAYVAKFSEYILVQLVGLEPAYFKKLVSVMDWVKGISSQVVPLSLRFLVIFVFAECLYTFRRLSDSILAIIRIKKRYLEHRLPK